MTNYGDAWIGPRRVLSGLGAMLYEAHLAPSTFWIIIKNN